MFDRRAICLLALVWLATGLAPVAGPAAAGAAAAAPLSYPETPRIAVSDTLHGVVLVDDYRWLEDGSDPKVLAWSAAQNALSRTVLDSLPQRSYLIRRQNELRRYDDEGIPQRVITGDRVFVWRKRADQEKWALYMKESDDAEARVVIDPNEWPAEETLSGAIPSRDGRYLAFGKERGGDETAVVRVLDIDSGALLPDTLSGWKQYVNCWLPDNSGFYYDAKPKPGSVPAGEEQYWNSAYEHRLGAPASADRKTFFDDKVKEYYHGAEVSEDGRYAVYYRWNFSRNEAYVKRLDDPAPPVPLATGFDAMYTVTFVDDLILITSDSRSPMGEVYVTDIEHPRREDWRVFIPGDEKRRLQYLAPVAGHLYAVYQENAMTVIKIYDREGHYLRDLDLPTLGSAYVGGRWSRDEVWVQFSSFVYPETSFKYDFASDSLSVYRRFPVPVDVTPYMCEQVWYHSADGTPVSMFLIHRRDLVQDGSHPTLLTGYGGFDSSESPYFSTGYLMWLESGGLVAIPNLRGGGEYGRAWHEAGMRAGKQRVFDDFIAAAEWLIANRYTNPDKLAILGGSNGGLLVGAVAVQRPDLFRAVDCLMPLLDMIRYHHFGVANIWAEEYGSSDDPEQFRYLLAYSPYQNVVDGRAYPSLLLVGSENDARVDPLHARKMAARLQAASPEGRPVLLLIQGASGHGGGTTLSMQIEQSADRWSFLMNELGMRRN